MEPNLNFDALRAFRVFSEHLNFTHAASELHISQPALHVKINDLAESLGVPLYRRIGRRLELTEQGRKVARFSRQISERTGAFLQELKEGVANEPVILAAGEGAYLYMLGETIRDFRKHTDYPLNLLTLDREGVIDSIRSGRAHIGVSPLESTPPGFESSQLERVDQMLVLPSSHPLASKRKLKLKDLTGSKLIVPPGDRPHRQMIAAALQSAQIEWEVAVEATGWELMLHFVKLGIGLAIVNSYCVIPRGLTARKLPGLPSLHYHAFNLEGGAQSGSKALLKKMLLRNFRNQLTASK